MDDKTGRYRPGSMHKFVSVLVLLLVIALPLFNVALQTGSAYADTGTPTPTVTSTDTSTPTDTATATDTSTATPTDTPTDVPATDAPTDVPATDTPQPTATDAATDTPTATDTPSPTATPPPTGPVFISTDKADYNPGSVVVLSGTGWAPGESVQVVVDDTFGQTWKYTNTDTADSNGNFVDTFTLPNTFVSVYDATATGSSGRVATTTFTDDNVVVAVTGVPSFTVTYTGFQNSTCTGAPGGNSGNQLVTGSGGTNIGVGSPGSVLLSAPATVSGAPFVKWTSGVAFTGTNPICVALSNGKNQLFTANYATVTATPTATPVTPTATATNTPAPTATPTPSNQIITFNPPASATYGDANFNVSATSSSGLTVSLAGSTPGVCTVTDNGNGSATVHIVASGQCTITASQGGNSSFNPATPVTKSITINKASLTVTASGGTFTYGGTPPAITPSYSGFVNGDNAGVLSGSPSCSTTATSSSTVAGSPYPSSCTVGTLTAANYTFSFVNGSVSVTRAPLTVTANNASRAYGASDPAFTATISGFVNGDTAGVVSGSANLTSTDTPTSAAGTTWAITPTVGSLSAANYSFTTFNAGTLTITKAQLTVTANNANRAYGDPDPSFSATFSGFVNGDTASVVSGTPNFSAGDTPSSPAGSALAITPSLGTLSATNYSFTTFNAGTLTVTKAPLTVTANNASRAYGDPEPSFTATITGFKNGETLATSGVSGSPALTGTDSAGSPAGSTWSIVPTVGTLTATNYSFTTFNNGVLTITSRAVTVTADANQSKTYGSSDPIFTYTVTTGSLASGDSFTGALSRAAGQNVGTYAITQGTLSAGSNYTITFVSKDFTINPATLTVTADDASKTYGAANPTFTASYSGFQNGDTATVLSGSPSLTTTADATSPAATYTITAAQGTLSASNYTFSFVNGTLTVGKAVLTVTANDASKVYGSANPGFSASYSGFQNGDTVSNLGGALAFSTSADASSPVGHYSITPSGLTSNNYDITFKDGTLSVTPAPLSVTANDASKTYGDPNPAFSVSYSGFVNNDDASKLDGTLTFTTAATPSSPAGPYSVTPSGLTSSNYTITFHDGTLTVNKAALTVTTTSALKTYGDPNPPFSVTYSGFVNGDDEHSLGGSLTFSTTADASSPVSGYLVTPGGLTSSNYAISFMPGTLTVVAAPLTVTANPASKTYGHPNPTFTVGYSGFVNSDGPGSLGGSLTFTTDATQSSDAGNYDVTPGGLTSSNYAITFVKGTLTINPAALTVTADDKTKTYGDANPTFTASYNGFVLGQGPGVLSGTLAFATPATQSSDVSTYSITPSGLTSNNYTISFQAGTLHVVPAALSITAKDASKTYGDANPAFDVSYSGFVLGQDSSVLGGTLSFSTPADPTTDVGTYSITPSGLTSSNYDITFHDGTLTITQAPLTITADNQGKIYGAANPTLTGTVTGLKNGDGITASYSTTATSASPVGAYPITPEAVDSSPSKLANYSVTLVNGTLSIDQAALTLTADNQSMTYGGSLPALTWTATGLVNGDTHDSVFTGAGTTAPTLSTAPATSHAGSYAITISSAVNPNYTITFVNGTLTIKPANLTITADSTSKVYGAALPALTASYAGLVNGDSPASLTTPPTLSTTATAASHVATYSITASGAVDADYTISYVAGTLTVTPAPLTITADNASIVYGTVFLPIFTWHANFVNGDTAASLSHQPGCVTSHFAGHVSGSPYVGAITCQGASDPDYTISYAAGDLTITPAPLTITASSGTMVYGGTVPTITAGYTGLVNGDTAATFSASPNTAPTCSTAATSTSDVGSYASSCSGAVDTDYTISYTNGVVTVTARPVGVTADAKTKVYGDADPALTYQITSGSLANGDTFSGALTRDAGEDVGSYAITQGTLALSTNYDLTYTGAQLSITPATLTVTADDKSKVYGDANPTFTASYSGFQRGENLASSGVTGSPSLTTLADNTSPVGGYAITAALGTLAAHNYTFSFVNGTLTVTARPVTITADAKTKVYGQDDPPLTYQVTSGNLVNGDGFSGSLSRDAGQTVGSYDITQGTVALSANYDLSYVGAQLTITPAPLTVVTDPQTKVYGDANPTLTGHIDGIQYGDNITAGFSTTATNASPVGSYPITATLSDPDSRLSNYTVTNDGNTLSVTVRPVTITADAKTKVYGDADPALTFQITSGNLVNGDGFSGALTRDAGENVGSYNITQGNVALSSNYALTYVGAQLSITKAPLTVTAENKSKVYGAALPTFTASYSGFKFSDGPSSLSGTLAFSTSADATSHVGTYGITPSGLTSGNYTITFVDGTLTVTPADLSITADDQSFTYGGSLPTLTATFVGLVNGDTQDTFNHAPNTALQLSTVPATSHAGSYIITASGAADPDYTITFHTGTLTITPAALNIKADDKSFTYGGTLPALTASYNGLVNGDTPDSLTTAPTLSTVPATSHAGSYTISVGGAVDPDYTISYTDGTLTISPAPLTIAADDKSMTYGGALPTLTWTPSGLVNGDTASSLTTAPALSTVPATSHAGSYAITASGAVDTDYTITYVPGTLTINPAALTITADDKSFTYGGSMPALTASYSGLVNGDSSAVFGNAGNHQVVLSTVPATSHAGGYVITASGAVDPDYTISFNNGTLTITPAPLTITADSTTKVYGAALPPLTASYTGLVNGDSPASLTTPPTLTTTATAASHVATYSITASGAVDADYTISYVAGTLTVTPVALSITAKDQTTTYGTTAVDLTTSAGTVSYSGFVNGDTPASLTAPAVLHSTGNAGSPVGTYPITVDSATDADYTISFHAGTLTINPAPLTVTATDKSMTYGGTQPALTWTATGLVNGDNPNSVFQSPNTAPTLGTAPANSHTGSYPITIGGAVNPNYTITFVNGTLTITPAPLTITASNGTMVYGGTVPTITAGYTGLVNGDTAATFSASPNTAPTCSTAATSTSDVGSYASSCSGAVDTDYTISYTNGSVTVTQAPLLVVVDSKTKVYGAPNPILTGTVTGVLNNDGITATYNTTAGASSTVAGSPYPITATLNDPKGKLGDYSVTNTPSTLTVTKAPLTITADNKSKTYGDANPTLTGTIVGIKNGDGITANYSTAADATTGVGTYSIVPAAVDSSPSTLGNYSVTLSNGTLSIGTRAVTITADPQTKVYGQSDPALTYHISAGNLVNGDGFSGSLNRVSGQNVGTYAINQNTVTLGSNYALSYVGATLTITPATLTVTADNKTRPVGTSNPAFTWTASGFQYSDTTSALTGNPALSTTATVNSSAGTYTISITNTGGNLAANNGNYTFNFVSGSLAVTTSYKWNGFLQPINDTAHTQTCGLPCPMSIFKAGSTIPVKFLLSDPNGNPITVQQNPLPTFLTPVQVGSTGVQVDEPVFQDSPSSGTTFSYDGGGQYHFNWKTSKSDAGKVIQIGAQLSDGSKVYVTIGLN